MVCTTSPPEKKVAECVIEDTVGSTITVVVEPTTLVEEFLRNISSAKESTKQDLYKKYEVIFKMEENSAINVSIST